MAFPETSILDDFNRSNEGPPLSSDWSPTGHDSNGWKVVSNVAQPDTSSGSHGEYYNVSTHGADCEAYATYGGGFAKNGLYARLVNIGAGTTDGYVIEFDSAAGNIKIERVDDGARTLLGSSISQTITGGDKLGIKIVGSTITAYMDDGGAGWASYGSRTDSTYSAAGNLGIRNYNASNTFDDFGGGTLAGGTTYEQAVAGTLTSAGIYALLVFLSLTGALNSAGALLKKTILNYAGALFSTGAVSTIKIYVQALAGALTSAGVLLKKTTLTHAGILTTSGAISTTKIYLRSLAGALTSAGALVSQGQKVLSGIILSRGVDGADLFKTTIPATITSTLTSSGALSAVKTFLQSIAGELLGSASNFGNITNKIIFTSRTGTLTSTSTIIKTTALSYSGSLSSIGSVVKTSVFSLAGTIITAGAIATIKNFIIQTIDLTLNSRPISFTLNARSTAMTLIQRIIDFTLGTRE
jgi:hypothetical protein